MPDAVVIGAGHNGLVAANLLVDRGWSVTVLEAADQPGGGARSAELIEPGYTNDLCSAFYPLAAVSPVLQSLRLDDWGLRWLRAPTAIAHPALDGSCPIISQEAGATAESLDALAPGDGDAAEELYRLWTQLRPAFTDALLAPFPPVRAGARVGFRARHDLGELTRLITLPVHRLGQERFAGGGARRLLAGLALHADLMPEAVLSGMFGWIMAGLAQEVGFPVPQGGASAIPQALLRRLEANGGTLVCGATVEAIEVRNGRAVAVRTGDGTILAADRAVVADVDAVQLYRRLIPAEALPPAVHRHLDRFHWDHATFKVDWNLDGPIPWSAPEARRAGTIHVTEDVAELTMSAATISTDRIPEKPFLVMGQQQITDPSRQPAGKDTAWAYTHLPRRIAGDAGPEGLTGDWAGGDGDRFADRMEMRVEALAPGFRALIRGRHVLTPDRFSTHEASMPLGAINQGTSQLHQQLVFRPIPGLGRAETPVRNLYLGSASAHPGGGVHGACGANAARAALLHNRIGFLGAPLRRAF